MIKPIPSELDNPLNQQILTHLDGQSCHTDIIAPIEKCLSELEGVKSYFPDSQNFAYMLWYVNGIVFAYASGMRNVGLRLSQSAELGLPMTPQPESFKQETGWYPVPYNSENLQMLVNRAYESAANS
ncbi:MAG: hypothetical protein N0C81_18885 [Candidatus Thiodiazotropha lotti]|nr:hypothetical protein [Candidatus Thiodiazotropha lotti]MCG8001871.1 hypothetical protein [Candidatus Thiodiazotropha lotti]MCG8009693.1 hypothetical protein [Candidatus Thiodiazotropha lotti]MCW4185489.1 hypothetical protein [Candidatus Thiodiazotropha lotti]MCW4197286.1 hypothetical protein [Candidatus Thiodiazotropha lotti]